MAARKIKLKDQLGRVVRVPTATVAPAPTTPPVTQPEPARPAATVWKMIREIPANIQKLAKLLGTGFTTRGPDGEWFQRQIEAGEGIDVAHGDGVAGNPAIGLAELADAGGGALQKTLRDDYGRLAGTSAATTSDLAEGGNLYFTDERADARAAAAIAAHAAAADPHPQYTTAAEVAAAIAATAGTVTSVALSVPTGLVVAGSPITASGTFTVSYAAGYQGYTAAEATKLAGIATGATVGAAWGANLSGIPANITSWAGIAPSTKENAGVAVAKNVELNIIDPALTLWRITAGTSPGADYQSILIDTGLVSASRGAYFRLFGSNHASAPGQVQIISGAGAPIIMSGGILRFNADNMYAFGAPSFRASVLYAGTGTINTSDAREKTAVRPLAPAELAAAAELGREIGVYQWLAMIVEKGDAARQHIGMTVQRATEILRSHGLDPFAYGFICYDQWDELPEIRNEWEALPQVVDDFGNLVQEAREAGFEVVQEYRPAGDRYSFRMDELLAFIARGLAHRLDVVEQRLAAAGL